MTDHVILPHKVESSYPYRENRRWDLPARDQLARSDARASWAGAVAPSSQLGTSVLVAPLRNPMLLAKQVSSLDHLSGGRVELGLGAGWMEEEFDLIGAPFADRGRRLIEMVRLMRELWSGETVDFQGGYWRTAAHRCTPARCTARSRSRSAATPMAQSAAPPRSPTPGSRPRSPSTTR